MEHINREAQFEMRLISAFGCNMNSKNELANVRLPKAVVIVAILAVY